MIMRLPYKYRRKTQEKLDVQKMSYILLRIIWNQLARKKSL